VHGQGENGRLATGDSPLRGRDERSAHASARAALAVAEAASRAVGEEGGDKGVAAAALGRALLEEAQELSREVDWW